jgi:hypothetical protein
VLDTQRERDAALAPRAAPYWLSGRAAEAATEAGTEVGIEAGGEAGPQPELVAGTRVGLAAAPADAPVAVGTAATAATRAVDAMSVQDTCAPTHTDDGCRPT